MLQPYLELDEIADEVAARTRSSSYDFNVFWVQVRRNRSQLAIALCERWASEPIIALPVISDGFRNANAISTDLLAFLEASRPALEAKAASLDSTSQRLSLVLLAYTSLGVPRCESPITLPAWLPWALSTETVPIEDITWKARATLSDLHYRDEIARSLFELDVVLQARLERTYRQDSRSIGKLLSLEGFRKRHKDSSGRLESTEEVFEAARAFLARKVSPSDFRPSSKERDGMVNRLLSVAQNTNPSRVLTPVEALEEALDLSGVASTTTHGVTVFALVYRPPIKLTTGQLMGVSLLSTILLAGMLITASHHAEDYPEFSSVVLRSVSYDLRSSLAELIELLQG